MNEYAISGYFQKQGNNKYLSNEKPIDRLKLNQSTQYSTVKV